MLLPQRLNMFIQRLMELDERKLNLFINMDANHSKSNFFYLKGVLYVIYASLQLQLY